MQINDEIGYIKKQLDQIIDFLNQKTNSEELITIEEAAKLSKMEYQKLRQMFLNGEIPGKRFGRAIRISKSALLKCREEKK
ncbi:helix-turn-helix domain-containing protein [Sulfurimonas sp. NW7]|uniref:helix-turn-helix domain-containing protein n=1 Tax=Sulfurimonas sp. NW7 TaxID=2922727 RepID=UPI003DA8C1DA